MFHTACIRYLDHLDHVDAPARLQLVSTPVSWNVDEKKAFLGLLEGKGGGAGLQTVHPAPWFTGEADSPKIRRKMCPRPTAISGSLGHHSIVFSNIYWLRSFLYGVPSPGIEVESDLESL